MKIENVMINGLPGNVAKMLLSHLTAQGGFNLVPYSLTGPEISEATYSGTDGTSIALVRPENRDAVIGRVKEEWGEFITIDYTHPTAVNENAVFYCKHRIPFVMGTTGGDRKALEEAVVGSDISAVIAPNMAKQIVGFQAMVAYAAENFPGLFSGYDLEIKESHQTAKADTSGTARAMVEYFNKLGVDYTGQEIVMIRDPGEQKAMGIPEAHINGHGWHTYTLVTPDRNATFKFVHNINGRDIYAHGTFDAVAFLAKKLSRGETGKVFSMIDVLKGA